MNTFTKISPAITLLAQETESCMFEKGSRGKLVARLLLTLAHDRAVRQLALKDSSPSLVSLWRINWSQPIPTTNFLAGLFSRPVVDAILSCTPENVRNDTTKLKDRFAGAFVRFSHFILMGELHTIDTHLGLAGAARGFAIQVSHQEEQYDIAIPVIMMDGAFTESDITFILIQVKDRVKPDRVDINAGKIPGFFTLNNTNPYITVCMELGAAKSDVQVKVSGRSATSRVTNPHALYAFTVYGHSADVYSVVSSTEDEKNLGGMLGVSTLSEHPRQHEDNIRLVRRMKHSWVRGVDCFDWIEDPVLRTPKALP